MKNNSSTSDIHTKNINANIAKIQKNLATTYQDILATQNPNPETLTHYKDYFDKINLKKQEKINMLNYIIGYLEQIKNSNNFTQEQKYNINNDIYNLKTELSKLQ